MRRKRWDARHCSTDTKLRGWTPKFTPQAGTYTTDQLVTLSTKTPGANLYFTTDGTTPTTSSTRYTGPIMVPRNTTCNAIAVAAGHAPSAVATAVYNIEPPASGALVNWENQVSRIRHGQRAQARLCFVGDSITASNVTITPLRANLAAQLGDAGLGWVSLVNQPLNGHYQDKDAAPLAKTTHTRPYTVPQSAPYTILVSRPPDQNPGVPDGDSYLADVSARYAGTGKALVSATVPAPHVSPCSTLTVCTPGDRTTYAYVVVANLAGGVSITPARSTTIGPAALDGSHFVEVATSPVPAANNCDVYRTAGGRTTGRIRAGITCGSVLRDDGTLRGGGEEVPTPSIPPDYYAANVDTGLYQFNAADAGKSLELAYTVWGMTIATGNWIDTYHPDIASGRGADATETNTADPQATMSLVCPKSDEVKVFYLKQPGGGSFTYNIDGLTARTVTSANETQTVGIIDIAGLDLAAGQHQWNFAMLGPGSAGVTLLGASCQANSIPGARIEKIAHSGIRADGMSDIPPALYTAQLRAIGCDLVMIRFSANERGSCLTTGCSGANSVTPDQFVRNLQKLYGTIHSALPGADIAFESENDNYVPDALYPMPDYTNSMQAVAQANSAGWLDSFGLMSPYRRIAALGLTTAPDAPPTGPDVHPSIAGGKIIAESETTFLLPGISLDPATPKFSDVTPSQRITYGTPSITLSGVISAPGPLYPTAGEQVTITIDGMPQTATIGNSGAFSTPFDTHTIPASKTAYTITYSYVGDDNFNQATNTHTALMVTPAQ